MRVRLFNPNLTNNPAARELFRVGPERIFCRRLSCQLETAMRMGATILAIAVLLGLLGMPTPVLRARASRCHPTTT
jgi:hypothetical protein